jgi:hypothetical protein
MTKSESAWLKCVELADDEAAYPAAYEAFHAAQAEEDDPIDPISGNRTSEPQEAPRRGRGRPSNRERAGLEALDQDPDEKPVPRWVAKVDIFRIAATGKAPRGIPGKVREELLDIAQRLRFVRASKARPAF